jgi:hypothetical protein
LTKYQRNHFNNEIRIKIRSNPTSRLHTYTPPPSLAVHHHPLFTSLISSLNIAFSVPHYEPETIATILTRISQGCNVCIVESKNENIVERDENRWKEMRIGGRRKDQFT